MAVGHISRREGTDEETDEEIADDCGKAEPSKAEAHERRAEEDDADLEDGDRVRHKGKPIGRG